MNKNGYAILSGLLLVAGMSCLSGWAQEPVAPVSPAAIPSTAVAEPKITKAEIQPKSESDTGSWIIGTRVTHFELQDDKRGTRFNDSFMGSITELKNEQNDTPNKPFVQYRLVNSPFWIGVSYDRYSGDTWDGGGSDGSVVLEGLIPYVQARWENTTRLVPYIEAGLAFYDVNFDESEGWSNDGSRDVRLDDSVMGMEIAGGLAVRVYKGLSLDLYARYMDVDDINGAYYINGDRDGDAIFTMSYVAYGVGLQYQF